MLEIKVTENQGPVGPLILTVRRFCGTPASKDACHISLLRQNTFLCLGVRLM